MKKGTEDLVLPQRTIALPVADTHNAAINRLLENSPQNPGARQPWLHWVSPLAQLHSTWNPCPRPRPHPHPAQWIRFLSQDQILLL